MMAFQVEENHNTSFGGLLCEHEPSCTTLAKFDLTLGLVQHEDGRISSAWEFDADLFDESTIDKWNRAFVHILSGLVNTPDQKIMALPMLSDQERDAILDQSSGKCVQIDHASHPSILKQFDLQVQQQPNSIALITESSTTSYQTLDALSNQWARHLIAMGIGADDVVGIMLDRSPESILAMLSTLKAGAAYLPLDPDLPSSRIDFMLGDSQARAVYVSSSIVNDLSSRDVLTITVDDPATMNQISTQSSQPIAANERCSAPHPDQLAYVIYTSGSTGLPKGVGISIRNITEHLIWRQHILNLGPKDKVLQKTAIGFDVSVWEWMLPLMTGSTLIIARPDGHRDPGVFASRDQPAPVHTGSFCCIDAECVFKRTPRG